MSVGDTSPDDICVEDIIIICVGYTSFGDMCEGHRNLGNMSVADGNPSDILSGDRYLHNLCLCLKDS